MSYIYYNLRIVDTNGLSVSWNGSCMVGSFDRVYETKAFFDGGYSSGSFYVPFVEDSYYCSDFSSSTGWNLPDRMSINFRTSSSNVPVTNIVATASSYNLVGTVYVDSTSVPLGQAMVSLEGGSTTTTNDEGKFSLPSGSNSTGTVTIRRFGINTKTATVSTSSSNIITTCNKRLMPERDLYALKNEVNNGSRCLKKSAIPTGFRVWGTWDNNRVPWGGYISYQGRITGSTTSGPSVYFENQTNTSFSNFTVWTGSSSSIIASGDTVLENSSESFDWRTTSAVQAGSKTIGVTSPSLDSNYTVQFIVVGGSTSGVIRVSGNSASTTVTIPSGGIVSITVIIRNV